MIGNLPDSKVVQQSAMTPTDLAEVIEGMSIDEKLIPQIKQLPAINMTT